MYDLFRASRYQGADLLLLRDRLGAEDLQGAVFRRAVREEDPGLALARVHFLARGGHGRGVVADDLAALVAHDGMHRLPRERVYRGKRSLPRLHVRDLPRAIHPVVVAGL